VPWQYPAAATGIPTVDGAAIAQHILQVMEAIQHTISLMDQYETQLNQYETQIRNSIAPSVYLWDKANETMAKLNRAQAQLSQYERELGGLEGYLNRLQTLDCYSAKGCSEAEWRTFHEVQQQKMDDLSVMTQKAGEAWTKALGKVEDEQKERQKKLDTLGKLQKSAGAAQGQMEALAALNQFANFQAKEIVLLREQLAIEQRARAVELIENKQREMAAREADSRFISGKNTLRTMPTKPTPWVFTRN